MRLLKKILATMLCIGMLVPCAGMTVFAADGRISFTDPQTAVGDMVDVKCVVKSTGGALGDVEVTIAYDSEALRFDSGENVTKTARGTLVYSGSADGAEATFVMTFQALKEESTKVTVSGANISSESGNSLTFDYGNSTVKIGPGDPSKIEEEEEEDDNASGRTATGNSIPVQVNGKNYGLTDTFTEIDIPNGFTETTVPFESTECTMVMQESSQIYLAWLVDAEGTGEFFLFNMEDATFSPFEQVMISDTTSIVIMSDDSLKLPEKYAATKLILNEKEFPAWQDTESENYYLMYAVNSTGQKAIYQYDSEEGTYQRFELPAEEEKGEDKDSSKGFIQDFVSKHLKAVAIVVGIIFFILLIILIVVSVKLSHRDLELDNLYDEYGIDVDDDGEYVAVEKSKKKGKGTAKKSSKKKKAKDDFDEDDFDEDDFAEDDFAEDDFAEDDFAEDDFAEDDFAEDDFENDDFMEDDFESDDFSGIDFDEDSFAEDEAEENDFATVRFDQKKLQKYNTLSSLEFDDYDDTDDYGMDAYADEAADDMIDDLDELLSKKGKASHSHAKKEDSYTVDFIDLD